MSIASTAPAAGEALRGKVCLTPTWTPVRPASGGRHDGCQPERRPSATRRRGPRENGIARRPSRNDPSRPGHDALDRLSRQALPPAIRVRAVRRLEGARQRHEDRGDLRRLHTRHLRRQHQRDLRLLRRLDGDRHRAAPRRSQRRAHQRQFVTKTSSSPQTSTGSATSPRRSGRSASSSSTRSATTSAASTPTRKGSSATRSAASTRSPTNSATRSSVSAT